MSVRIPIVDVNPVPMPQFSTRSRREAPVRDTVNARNTELWRSSPPVPQGMFRPNQAMTATNAKSSEVFYDQMGIPSRNVPPKSVPAPPFDPNGSKLEGNQYFDQYAPSFDPRNVARELRGVVAEPKQDRGILESQRLLRRGFSGRYVPEGYAEQNQFDSLQAYESLKPKIDDGTKQYRQYN